MDSELLEPALVKLLGCIMREIAEFSEFPPMDKWREWHYRLKGVSDLMVMMFEDDRSGPYHASRVFGDHRYKLVPYFSRNDWLDDAQAQLVWKSARKTIYQK